MNTPPVNPEKLAGADLRAFAAADDGTRSVVVELDRPAPPAAPPVAHLPGPRRPGITLRPAEPDPDDIDARMADLERELQSLNPPSGLTRLDLARAFVVTVTPAILRALTRLPHVGIVRPRQTVQSA